MRHRSKTVTAIRAKYHYLINWTRAHRFHYSMVHDILNKRGQYSPPGLKLNPDTRGYDVLRALIIEGYGDSLRLDGWNPEDIDITVPGNVSSRPVEKYRVPWNLENEVFELSSDLADTLGDDFTNNVFFAHADGGPAAVMYLMQGKDVAAPAIEYLCKAYPKYEFYRESFDVISIWIK